MRTNVASDQFDPSIAWHFVRSGFSVDPVNISAGQVEDDRDDPLA